MKSNIQVAGIDIKKNDDGLVSLTDLYATAQAQGMADGKQSPYEWSRRDGAQFIEFLAENLNTAKRRIYQAERGKGGGTFAHWQIALAYAKYLSPALHMQVNEVYVRFQTADPALAESIIDRTTNPADAKRLAARANGKVARLVFTSTLSDHGVEGKGFKDCTNAVYLPLFNGTAKEIREARGLPGKANARDHMETHELIAVSFAELLATKQIKTKSAFGNQQCAQECNRAAHNVAELIRAAGAKV